MAGLAASTGGPGCVQTWASSPSPPQGSSGPLRKGGNRCLSPEALELWPGWTRGADRCRGERGGTGWKLPRAGVGAQELGGGEGRGVAYGIGPKVPCPPLGPDSARLAL